MSLPALLFSWSLHCPWTALLLGRKLVQDVKWLWHGKPAKTARTMPAEACPGMARAWSKALLDLHGPGWCLHSAWLDAAVRPCAGHIRGCMPLYIPADDLVSGQLDSGLHGESRSKTAGRGHGCTWLPARFRAWAKAKPSSRTISHWASAMWAGGSPAASQLLSEPSQPPGRLFSGLAWRWMCSEPLCMHKMMASMLCWVPGQLFLSR